MAGGRPTKFKAEYVEQAYKLCLVATTGVTDAALADFFEVTETTINNWKNQHPEFLESLKNGKEVADAEVADALYQRALGYSHPEEKIFHSDGEIIRADTTKHYPPDTAAAFIWLKNRAGWRDRQDVDLRTPDGIQVKTVRVPEKAQDANAWAERFRGAAASTNGSSTNGAGGD